jgi:hypothetical protein
MADDNPDSTVIELLQLIERQSAMLSETVERLSAAAALVDCLQEKLDEYERSRTKFDRSAHRVTSCIEMWEPPNSWVN